MVSGNTNNTVLELSRSESNTKDISNNNNKDNNTKLREWDDTNDIENKSDDGVREKNSGYHSLIQDTGGKKDITSNKNKQSNDDTKKDTKSGNEDEEVDKTKNDNMRNMCKRKGTPQMVTTKKKKRTD